MLQDAGIEISIHFVFKFKFKQILEVLRFVFCLIFKIQYVCLLLPV